MRVSVCVPVIDRSRPYPQAKWLKTKVKVEDEDEEEKQVEDEEEKQVEVEASVEGVEVKVAAIKEEKGVKLETVKDRNVNEYG